MPQRPNPVNRATQPLRPLRTLAEASDNQGAKWGVSDFGTLSPFDSKPVATDFLGLLVASRTNSACRGPFVDSRGVYRAVAPDAPDSLVLAQQLKDHLWDGRLGSGACHPAGARRAAGSAASVGRPAASAARAGKQRGLFPSASAAHGLSDVPAEGLADRIGRDRVGRQAVQQTGERDGAVLESAGRGIDLVTAGCLAVARRSLATVLVHPPRLPKGRLKCHGPFGG